MNTDALTMIFKKNKFIYHCLPGSPDKTCYLLKFELKACNTDYIIEKHHAGNKLMFIYAIFPVKVPVNKRTEMAVFTALFNNNLASGCWELNMKDGSLRFRISYMYEEKNSSFERIFLENLDQSIRFTDICTQGILSVIFADANPHEVFQELTKAIDVKLN
ncbi:MAG: hypothetical protein PHQ11_05145 [Paludibacter sp.]|nr:hypothetical protein [Paludibacter sp.]MDD4197835.1 hypothetical protein [Paludibacter sp.]MDD4427878.1 hypothetical protein [Paludibacter sp.]